MQIIAVSNHPVVKQILANKDLPHDFKAKAIKDIELMLKDKAYRVKVTECVGGHSNPVEFMAEKQLWSLFEWKKSNLGFGFWAYIGETIGPVKNLA